MRWKAFVKPFSLMSIEFQEMRTWLCLLLFGAVNCIFILQKSFIVNEPNLQIPQYTCPI